MSIKGTSVVIVSDIGKLILENIVSMIGGVDYLS